MKRRICPLIVFVVATTALAAQQNAPAPPNPLGQPLVDAAGNVREEAMLRTPLLPEDRAYAGLEGRG